MDLHESVQLVRRRWLFVAVFAAIGAVAAGVPSARQTPMYAATVTMIVSSADGDGGATQAYQANLLSQQRVKSYADLVASDRIAGAVVEKLKISENPAVLRGRIRAQAVPDTVLLTATVTDPSAARAQVLADTVGSVFSTTIARTDAPGGGNVPSVRIAVWQQAKLPSSPASPHPVRATVLGLLLGLVVGVGAAALRGRLDSSISTEKDVHDATGLPILGEIVRDTGAAHRPLFLRLDERSRRAEEFRQLRTNLRFAAVDSRAGSILVTSPLPGDGKTTTSCNLAITTALTGARVLLIEADLRHPSFGKYLGLESAAGLTSILVGAAALDEVVQPWGASGLHVLCGGPVPPNPTELLGSRAMSRLLANLTTDYDLVILDAPPLLPVADASVLATEVAGVLVVARAGRTRRDQMIRAVERLKTVDARILGVLLNMVPGRRADHYDYSLASRQRSGNRDRRLGLRWRPATGMRTVDFPPGSEVARSHSSAPTAASLLIPRVAPDQETLLLPTGAEGVDDLSGPPTDPPAGRSHLGPFRP